MMLHVGDVVRFVDGHAGKLYQVTLVNNRGLGDHQAHVDLRLVSGESWIREIKDVRASEVVKVVRMID